MKCNHCGEEVTENMKFCPSCGEKLEEIKTAKEEKEKSKESNIEGTESFLNSKVESTDSPKEAEENPIQEVSQMDEKIKPMNQASQPPKKKHIFSWIVCVFMVLSTVALEPYSNANLLTALCALLTCPPIVNLINKWIHNKFKTWIQVILVIILFFASSVVYSEVDRGTKPTNTTKPTNSITNTTSQNITTKNNTTKNNTTENKTTSSTSASTSTAKKSTSSTSSSKSTKNKTTVKNKPSTSSYTTTYRTYSYKDIARNPSRYVDKKMKFTGKVMQVSQGLFGGVTLLVNVTRGEYGFYEDSVYCTYTYKAGESKVLEDDIVTVYGTCKGDTTYLSVLGAAITVPKLEVDRISIH